METPHTPQVEALTEAPPERSRIIGYIKDIRDMAARLGHGGVYAEKYLGRDLTFIARWAGELAEAMNSEFAESDQLRGQLAAVTAERDEVERRAYRCQRDRARVLDVKTTEGLSASEWLMRTANAEADRDRLRAVVEEYADERNWEYGSNAEGYPTAFLVEWYHPDRNQYPNGYDRARAALDATDTPITGGER